MRGLASRSRPATFSPCCVSCDRTCSTEASFDEAQAICGQVGLKLVTIDDPEENDWLSQQVDRPSYIGLADANPGIPHEPGIVPELIEKAIPLHEVIPVDQFLRAVRDAVGVAPGEALGRQAGQAVLRGLAVALVRVLVA